MFTSTRKKFHPITLCSGISVSAMKTVFPGLPSYYVDNVVTVLLSKAFTPSLVVFLFLSSTFGLYKLAQISSDQTNYTE